MNLKYFLGSIISIPLLPWMYYSGKRVRQEVPKLSEATDSIASYGSQPTEMNLLVIGESTMAGVGVFSHKDGFTGSLASHISEHFQQKVNWEVMAKSGYTAAMVGTKLIPKIKMTTPDLIVIGLGANDAFTLNTPRQWTEHILSLLNLLQQKFHGVPIVFLNMPPIHEFPALPWVLKNTVGKLVNVLGEELEKLVTHFDKVYYNSETISLETWGKRYRLSENSTKFFSDGIHPSAYIYQLWAKEMWEFIKRNDCLDAQKLT